MDSLAQCDGVRAWARLTALTLPFAVDDVYSSTALSALENPPLTMAPNENGGSRACEGMRAPAAQGACHSAFIDAFPQTAVTAGASWLQPFENRGFFPGRRIAPGAAHVRFQARGERGGEVVTFGAGGNFANTSQDSFEVDTPPLTLTSEWQTFSVDLVGVDYSSAVVGFYWKMDLATNTGPFQIYVDDIVWE